MKKWADERTFTWLLDSDPAIEYIARRDLSDDERPEIRRVIPYTGWGKAILDARRNDGHWGERFYQPKWTSTHYSLLDLRHLECPPLKPVLDSVRMVFEDEKGEDGGINPSRFIAESDVCINGMALNYGCFFSVAEELCESIVDFILGQQMADGGFNCRRNRSGAVHSSLHSTMSIVEGIHEYRRRGYRYRVDELSRLEKDCREFILRHRLFKSDRTGEIISKRFLKPVWPARWYYDIHRALDYFAVAAHPFDERMTDALTVLMAQRRKDLCWPNRAAYPGKVHVKMEEAGKSGRWNTLRALRILRAYGDYLQENGRSSQ